MRNVCAWHKKQGFEGSFLPGIFLMCPSEMGGAQAPGGGSSGCVARVGRQPLGRLCLGRNAWPEPPALLQFGIIRKDNPGCRISTVVPPPHKPSV